MSTNPESPFNEIEAGVQSGITRRTFIKRTGATAVVTALAIHAFRDEARADYGSSWTVISITCDFTDSGTCLSKEEAEEVILASIRKGGKKTENYGRVESGMCHFDPPAQNPDPFKPEWHITPNANGTFSWTLSGTLTLIFWGWLV